MTLKLGPIPDRNPVKLNIALPPDVHEALGDYAKVYRREYGADAPIGDLAALMIERFLTGDSAFKRARKSLRNSAASKE